MRAASFETYGGPEVLSVGERPDPVVGPDVVMVRFRATSVNPVDWKVREGFLQERYPHHLPIVPGWDVAGVVEHVGPAVVTGAEVGDEVWGYVRRDDVGHGTAAELVAAPERTVARKPAGLSFEEAACVPLAGLTAWQALTEAMRVSAGERVLVHAASGGVGQMAVQIATALGAEVVGTASPRNHELVRWARPPCSTTARARSASSSPTTAAPSTPSSTSSAATPSTTRRSRSAKRPGSRR